MINYTIRNANSADIDHILPLFPRLADFDLPPERVPEHLWESDALLLKTWSLGEATHCLVKVAVDDHNTILGAAMVTLREELLSHEPSAHLEVVVLDKQAEGQGIGKSIIRAAEASAREQGALSMTLHVFARNTRVHHICDQLGYEGELIRYIKHFD